MLKDVVYAVYKGGYKIEVTFEDGVIGIVDFSKYLSQGGVFEKFKDIEFFKNFSINKELGVLTWGDDEVDIAPETLYAEATNAPLPDWMTLQQDSSANLSYQPTSKTRRLSSNAELDFVVQTGGHMILILSVKC